MAYAIKAQVCDPHARTFAFTAQRTMYGGKQNLRRRRDIRVREREQEGKVSSRAALCFRWKM